MAVKHAHPIALILLDSCRAIVMEAVCAKMDLMASIALVRIARANVKTTEHANAMEAVLVQQDLKEPSVNVRLALPTAQLL